MREKKTPTTIGTVGETKNKKNLQERNKPKEPPKVPQKAPFFLPSTLSKPDSDSSTQLVSAPAAAAAEGSLGTKKTTPAERSRIAKLQLANDPSMQPSTFTALLHSCSSDSNNGNSSDSSNSNHYAPFIEYLKSLPPAKADLEIRSLDPGLLNGRKQGMNELVAFVEALTAQLRTRRDFELVNAWMAVFLRVHGDVAVEGESVGAGAGFRDGGGDDNEAETTRAALREALARWKVEQEREGRRLAELVGYCRGVVGFLRSAR